MDTSNGNGQRREIAPLDSPQDRQRFEITAAPKGVAAIIGHSRFGPTMVAQRCHSESEFSRHFGGFEEAPVLAAVVKGFFANGGTDCFVVNLGEKERVLQAADFNLLDDLADVEIVCAPGKTETSDHQLLIGHCSKQGTRLAVLDAPVNLSRQAVSFRPVASHFGAIYTPWLRVYNPSRSEVIEVPPAGHIAGLFARVAKEKGLKKAPANEPLLWLEGLAHEITQAEQDILHPRRINCIRKLPKLDGIRPWGAQTLGDRGPFQSISPFRVFSFVVRSFETAAAWLSGSNSEPEVWARLLRAGSVFLTDLLQSGELAGQNPDEAFRLRCDSELNTPKLREEGVVLVEIGLALGRPNAFYTFKMGLKLNE